MSPSDMLGMDNGGLYVLAVVVVGALWAGSALLYRMAMEKDRLWQRYEQLKSELVHQEDARRRKQQQARLTIREAHQADLAGEPLAEGELAVASPAGPPVAANS